MQFYPLCSDTFALISKMHFSQPVREELYVKDKLPRRTDFFFNNTRDAHRRQDILSGCFHFERSDDMSNIFHVPALSLDLNRKPFSLTGRQKQKLRSLIRKECCNYDSWYDECLGPCGHSGKPCMQMDADQLICRWLEHAVLPLDRDLQAEIIRDPSRKHCVRCGVWFLPGSNRALYCPTCASKVKKEHKRESARKRRERPSL